MSAEVLAYYRLLKAQKQLTGTLLAEYRCGAPDGHLLLHIFQTPPGPAFYQPHYKLSRGRSLATSTEEARLKNTRDGDHDWNEQAGLLAASANVLLNCDHVTDYSLGDPVLSDRPGKVRPQIIPPDTR